MKGLKQTAIEQIFSERQNFIIIGLTGRTGCGCTTVAGLLSKKFSDLQPPRPVTNGSIDDREYRIVYEYAKDSWMPFQIIEMKHIIFTFILENEFNTLTRYIEDEFPQYQSKIDSVHQLRSEFNQYHEKCVKIIDELRNDNDKKALALRICI